MTCVIIFLLILIEQMKIQSNQKTLMLVVAIGLLLTLLYYRRHMSGANTSAAPVMVTGGSTCDFTNKWKWTGLLNGYTMEPRRDCTRKDGTKTVCYDKWPYYGTYENCCSDDNPCWVDPYDTRKYIVSNGVEKQSEFDFNMFPGHDGFYYKKPP